MEYGVRVSPTLVIVGPNWTCEADVIRAQHGIGFRPGGDLVVRADDTAPWELVRARP